MQLDPISGNPIWDPINPISGNPNWGPPNPPPPNQSFGWPLYNQIITELTNGNTSKAITDLTTFSSNLNAAYGAGEALCDLSLNLSIGLQNGKITPQQALTDLQQHFVIGNMTVVFGSNLDQKPLFPPE